MDGEHKTLAVNQNDTSSLNDRQSTVAFMTFSKPLLRLILPKCVFLPTFTFIIFPTVTIRTIGI